MEFAEHRWRVRVMNVGRGIAVLIWLIMLAGALASPPAPHPDFPPLSALPKIIILFPFFLAVGSLFGGYPFDYPRLRAWADRRWGDGAYVGFIQDLKPMLWFAAVPVAGIVGHALHT